MDELHASAHGVGFSETTYCAACIKEGMRRAHELMMPALQAATYLQLAMESLEKMPKEK